MFAVLSAPLIASSHGWTAMVESYRLNLSNVPTATSARLRESERTRSSRHADGFMIGHLDCTAFAMYCRSSTWPGTSSTQDADHQDGEQDVGTQL